MDLPKAAEKNPWLFSRAPQKNAPLRLICFPYGGGGASAYRQWQGKLGEHVEVCPIQLPGRENRYADDLYDDAHDLVEDMLPALLALFDRPVVFLGYSMGAVIAYQLAAHCEKNDIPIDLRMSIVCASKPPNRQLGNAALDLMSDDAFLDYIISLGGAKEIIKQESFRQMALRLLRSDFRLSASVVAPHDKALSTPFLAIGGEADATVSMDELNSWRRVTSGDVETAVLPGGHFHMINESDALLDLIRPILLDLALDGATPAAPV